MPNILKVKFSKLVGYVDEIHPLTGAKYLYFFTPNDGGLERAQAGLGYIYLPPGAEYTWEPEETPPTLPTSGKYRVVLAQGVNVRANAGTQYKDIGDLNFGQVVEIDFATVQGSRYLWGKILSIENPTPTQVEMLAIPGERWVALRDGNDVWLEPIASA